MYSHDFSDKLWYIFMCSVYYLGTVNVKKKNHRKRQYSFFWWSVYGKYFGHHTDLKTFENPFFPTHVHWYTAAVCRRKTRRRHSTRVISCFNSLFNRTLKRHNGYRDANRWWVSRRQSVSKFFSPYPRNNYRWHALCRETYVRCFPKDLEFRWAKKSEIYGRRRLGKSICFRATTEAAAPSEQN